MARVERVVMVVSPYEGRPQLNAFISRRYAELSNGTRVEDPRWRARGFVSHVFGRRAMPAEARAAEDRAHIEQSVRRRAAREGDPEGLPDAVRKMGVAVSADELLRLPVDVEFTDSAAEQLLRPPEVDGEFVVPRKAKVIAAAISIALGAVWPSLNRYRAWRRQSPRRRVLELLLNWLVPVAITQWRRRTAPAAEDQPLPPAEPA